MSIASFATGAVATCPNNAALQAVGGATGDLCFLGRMRVDELLAVPAGGASALMSVDDLTNPNCKFYIHTQDQAGTAKQIAMAIVGTGSVSTGFIPNAAWGALGTYIVFMLYHKESTKVNGVAVFDQSGTNRLLDGLARGASAFWKTTTAYSAPFAIIANNGAVRLNVCASGATRLLKLDGFAITTVVPAVGHEDDLPSAGMAGLLTGALFDDAVGSTTFANLKPGAGVFTAVPSNGITIEAGGIWAPPARVATSVTGTPASASLVVGDTADLIPETDDQFGAAMASRSYTYASSNPALATVSGAGHIVAVAPGTPTITVHDTGGTASDWVVPLTVSPPLGTTYDITNPLPAIATATTGVTGVLGSIITDVAAGTDTLTVTRHGSALTCTVSVVCAGAGVGNEPAGMITGLNTGDITTPPLLAGSWSLGAPSAVFTNWTPATPAVGIDPSYLALALGGIGYETKFTTALHGGTNPAVWGCSIGPVQPLGVLFLDMYIRARGPSAGVPWSNHSIYRADGSPGPLTVANKLCEPVCGQGSPNHENHVLAAWTADDTTNYAEMMLQYGGPGGFNNFPRFDVKIGAAPGYYPTIVEQEPNGDLQFALGAWRRIQALYGQETVAGVSGDAYMKLWVASTLSYDSTVLTGPWAPCAPPINMLQSTSTKGWSFLMFNNTYGGLGASADLLSPPQTQWLGYNRLYASAK